ncbi:MAG TPA: DoxX family protein [Chthoniobacterales bacterium]|nr:DoxX family protein [Chthoniobacterales bacterium]
MLDSAFFKQHRDYAPIFLRILIGSFIIWGVQDNILSWHNMLEFEQFLRKRGVPYSLFAANLSVYAQLICGIAILLGAFIRPVSVIFIINFIFAIVIAHRGDSFRGMFPALMMIAVGLFFLFNGAGKFSIDELLERRRQR